MFFILCHNSFQIPVHIPAFTASHIRPGRSVPIHYSVIISALCPRKGSLVLMLASLTHNRNHIIFRAHRIGLIKLICCIVFISCMIREICFTLQEIFVRLFSRIPRCIQIIIQIIQLYNIPSVCLRTGLSRNQTVINSKFQRHPVKQYCISLTYCLSIYQSTISRKLESIVFIVLVFIIILDMTANIIIDCPDFLIITLIIHI